MRIRQIIVAAVYVAAASLIAMVAIKVSLNEEHRADVLMEQPGPEARVSAVLAKTGLGMQPVAVDRSIIFHASEAARQGLLGVAVPAWLFLVLLSAFRAQYRLVYGRWLRVLAVLAALAWLLNPTFALTWEGMIHNRYLAVGIVMVLFSLGFGRTPPHPTRPAQESA